MSSIGLTVKFLSILREICFSKNRQNFQFLGIFFKYAYQILHERLSIKSLETKLSTFLGEKIYWSTVFLVFLETGFLGRSYHCAQDFSPKFHPIDLKILPQILRGILQR